jgi:hypothetical protein
MEFKTVERCHWEGNWSTRPNSRRLSGANVFNSEFLALVGSVNVSCWSHFIAERRLAGTCFEFGGPSPWVFSLSRLGVLGRIAQIAWNFRCFAISRRLSPLRSMLVIELTE